MFPDIAKLIADRLAEIYAALHLMSHFIIYACQWWFAVCQTLSNNYLPATAVAMAIVVAYWLQIYDVINIITLFLVRPRLFEVGMLERACVCVAHAHLIQYQLLPKVCVHDMYAMHIASDIGLFHCFSTQIFRSFIPHFRWIMLLQLFLNGMSPDHLQFSHHR